MGTDVHGASEIKSHSIRTLILLLVFTFANFKMGKGFNNYMCKKFFHPGSRDNLKRVWMAQQKTESDKKKQDLYVNRSLVSKESKEKLSVNFLYEPPPGMKKEREKEDSEPEFKFDWQRKFNAPHEDYCRDNDDIRDQPFGIAVRNVRCIKCHKWGHINTDRECSLFNQDRDSEEALTGPIDPSQKLLHDMKESGLAMTRSALNTLEQMKIPMQKPSAAAEPSAEEELAFLKTMSTKDKKKLLKKLEKLENKDKDKKKKKKKEKKEKKRKRHDSSSCESSDDRKKKYSREYRDNKDRRNKRH